MPTITCPSCAESIQISLKIGAIHKPNTPSSAPQNGPNIIVQQLQWWLQKGFTHDPQILTTNPYSLAELTSGFAQQFQIPMTIAVQNMRRWLSSLGQTMVTRPNWGKVIHLDATIEPSLIPYPENFFDQFPLFDPTLYPYPLWSSNTRRYIATPATQHLPPIISVISIPKDSYGRF